VARATNDAVWDLDWSSDTLWWNEHLPEILGWPPDTPASRTRWIDAIHQDDREDVVARLFSSAPDRPNPLVLEHRFVRFDGSVGHAMLRAFCLRDPQGGLRRLVGSMLDLTERKRREDELHLRNQELERFTYTVSHDLKSPLITIRGFAGSMRNDLTAGRVDRLPGDVDRIALAADKMSDLLGDLLELSRIGRVMNPPVDVSLEELARDALALLAGRIEESRANVVVASGLPTVRGDRQRLLEVIQNLVENALKFAKAGVPPSVEIGVRTTHGETVFYVADDGIGIAERDRDTVFSLFTKLDPRSEGTGIGLALVRRIVEVHGGRIWIESDGIGRGATFCFTLTASTVDS
jgi:PAS domain S-box-containing protein